MVLHVALPAAEVSWDWYNYGLFRTQQFPFSVSWLHLDSLCFRSSESQKCLPSRSWHSPFMSRHPSQSYLFPHHDGPSLIAGLAVSPQQSHWRQTRASVSLSYLADLSQSHVYSLLRHIKPLSSLASNDHLQIFFRGKNSGYLRSEEASSYDLKSRPPKQNYFLGTSLTRRGFFTYIHIIQLIYIYIYFFFLLILHWLLPC